MAGPIKINPLVESGASSGTKVPINANQTTGISQITRVEQAEKDELFCFNENFRVSGEYRDPYSR